MKMASWRRAAQRNGENVSVMAAMRRRKYEMSAASSIISRRVQPCAFLGIINTVP